MVYVTFGNDSKRLEEFLDYDELNLTEQIIDHAELLLMKLEIIFILYVPPLIIILGLFCNVFVAVPAIVLALSPISCPLHIYSAFIIVLHSILLTTSYGLQWVDMYFFNRRLRNIRTVSHLYCQLSHYFEKVLLGMDHWLVVCLAIECLVLLRNSDRAFRLRRRNVRDVILVALTCELIINMHYFWTHLVVVEINPLSLNKENKYCRVRAFNFEGSQMRPSQGMILKQISPLINEMIPSLVVAITLVVIAKSLYASRCRLANSMSNLRADGDLLKRRSHFIADNNSYDDMARRVSIALTLSHLVCIAPKVLITQPFDDFVVRQMESSNIKWTFITVIVNTVQTIYYCLPVIIFLVNCRAYKQIIRHGLNSLINIAYLKYWSILKLYWWRRKYESTLRQH